MSSSPTRLVAAGVTDVGKTREINEDNILVEPELDLFVVADGMGGHSAGDVASSLATKSIALFFNDLREHPPASDGGAVNSQALPPEAQSLVTAIRKANQELYAISSTDARHKGMGSTIVALLFSREQGQVHVAHVGDSRCYRIRDGKIEQLTRDHSLVNEALALKPDLTKAQIARLPKNVITRALGMAPVVQVDIRTEKLQPGDAFLLCSDGLSGLVPDDQMLEIVGMAEDTNEACELLIAFANEAGGTDNISALVVRVEGGEGETEEAAASSDAIEIDQASSKDPESLGLTAIEPASEETPPAAAAAGDEAAAVSEEPAIGHARLGEAEVERAVTNAESLRKTAAMEAPAEEAAPGIVAVSEDNGVDSAAISVGVPESIGAPDIEADEGALEIGEGEDIPPELLAEAEEVAAIDVEAPPELPPEDTGPPVFISAIIDINAPPGASPPPPPIEPRPKARPERAPARGAEASSVEAVEVSEAPELMSEFADTLVGDEIDALLDDREAPPTSFIPVARCSSCHHELYIGNLFCTECGARVED